MSAAPGESGAFDGVPQSSNPSETLAVEGSSPVHLVPPSPSDAPEFGANMVPDHGPEHLITVQELAAAWRVCTATIYGLVKSGSLRSLRVGNSIRFTPSDVDAYAEKRLGAPTLRPPPSSRSPAAEATSGGTPPAETTAPGASVAISMSSASEYPTGSEDPATQAP